MIKKILITLLLLIAVSCEHVVDKKEVIAKIKNDTLIIKRVDVIQESNYYNVITDLKITVNSSIQAWENSPELNQFNRVNSINIVSKKFLKKLKSIPYLNEDKVIAYRFIKTYQSKEFIGYAVILFHNKVQTTLYYEIHEAPYSYCPSGVKQLINKGLLKEINQLEEAYYKKHPLKP